MAPELPRSGRLLFTTVDSARAELERRAASGFRDILLEWLHKVASSAKLNAATVEFAIRIVDMRAYDPCAKGEAAARRPSAYTLAVLLLEHVEISPDLAAFYSADVYGV